MKRLRFPAPPTLHGDNLEAELAVFGARDLVAVGADIEITVNDDADEGAVAAAVAAHTGALTPAQQADLAADAEARTAADLPAALLTKCRAVIGGTGSFTAAQRDELVARLVLVVHRRLG